jgi:hypothetical protein
MKKKNKKNKKTSKAARRPSDHLRHLLAHFGRVQFYLEHSDIIVLVLSKKGKRVTSRRKVAEFAAFVDTRSRLEGIIRGYGTPDVSGSTVIGPAVPSMSRFTGDVNRSFDKNYLLGTLHSDWDVDITADFIDKH